jgi:hypothetical protein
MDTSEDRRVVIHDAERILSKIRYTPDCWEWTGMLCEHGYGVFHLGAARVRAHRWVYELLAGPIPAGLVMDHLCRNRKCVRPSHLEPVTDRENILRGVGPSAVNAAKVRCPKGHEYTARPTGTPDRTWRFCRVCHRERSRIAMAASRGKRRAGREPCSVCGLHFAVKADGTVYRHLGMDADGGTSSDLCPGTGLPPAAP